MNKYLRLLFPALTMALLARPGFAEELYGSVVVLPGDVGSVIEGEAFAVDGGTISIRLQPIRLYGIQTWEHDKSCDDGRTRGDEAKRLLTRLIEGQIVTCLVEGWAGDRGPTAVCSVGNADLSEAMILNGVALADTFSTQAYRGSEQTARALGAGYHEPSRPCR